MHPLVVKTMSPTTHDLEQLAKTMCRVAFHRKLKNSDHLIIT